MSQPPMYFRKRLSLLDLVIVFELTEFSLIKRLLLFSVVDRLLHGGRREGTGSALSHFLI